MRIKRQLVIFLMVLFAAGFLYTGRIEANAASKYTIYVNRRTNIVNVVNSSTGKLVRAMYCSTGKGYSTIGGTYNTVSKMRWHALYHGVWGQYCTRIHGAYLFHSVWYYSPNKTKVSTVEYNKLGTQASAGCVRLAVVDAKWIYDNCGIGTKVVIGESRLLKKPSREKLKLSTASKTGWDPTDPDSANPYYPKISLRKKVSKKLEYGSKFNALKMIKVTSKTTSSAELLKCVTVKGKVKTKKPGKYKVIYKVTDPKTLLVKMKQITFTVKKKPETVPSTQTDAQQTEAAQ